MYTAIYLMLEIL